ncbi:beta-glucosidase, partial [Streptomyces calidiresistens]
SPAGPHGPDERIERAIRAALAALDLDTKAALLAGQDMWTLPAVPAIGLDSLVMSDGPIGVRGRRWTADDPSIALPSPTALAATWDPGLARRTGHLLAAEAHRKGVHVLLAPTVNLHRSPLGGRHFECYSEDPLLSGLIGAGYVAGVQEGGIATTVKHFVANDAETDRFTVDNRVEERTLRELYLRPFEIIVERAAPWGVMAAYNSVNGTTMSEHAALQNGVLRGEWGFDGFIVSDWMAARDTVGAIRGGLDVAMPGPRTVYGPALAAAVREGRVEEELVDAAVLRVLRVAARTGALTGTDPVVAPADRPPVVDAAGLAREVARRSLVLLTNRTVPGGPAGADRPALPLEPAALSRLAVSGVAARDARVLGGGSATVFPERVVSPLDGLRAALPEGTVLWTPGADPNEEPQVAGEGFALRAVCRDADGAELGGDRLPNGQVQWMGDFPEGVAPEHLATVEVTGTFTPRTSGAHGFGTRGLGGFRLEVAGEVLYDGVEQPGSDDAFEAFFGGPRERGTVELTKGEEVTVSLRYTVPPLEAMPFPVVGFALTHREPVRPAEELIAEAVEAARGADAAVVVVATTERVESEGFDRTSLELPGRQNDLVEAVAAVNPRTVVVVNAGSPVEMPWRDRVAAVLLGWFGGQEIGSALAEVLLGAEEPGGRLPTTWPARLTDAPVTGVVPTDGELHYGEGVFIGYRAWDRRPDGPAPAFPFGHGLGYTGWEYEELTVLDDTAIVRVRNTGDRPGRETVQLYAAPDDRGAGDTELPVRRLVGFATVTARPGETVQAVIDLDDRAFELWDAAAGGWRAPGTGWTLHAGRSVADLRLAAPARS